MKFLTFLLTKTRLARLIATGIAALLISWGWVKSSDKEVVGGAVATILVAAGSALIEKKKDEDAKEVQDEVEAKPDGWVGPETKIAIRRKVEAARRAANPKA